MNRCIYADKIIDKLKERYCEECDIYKDNFGMINISCDACYVENFFEIIDAQPTADVVEVVRCKDCKYWQDQEEGIVEVPNKRGQL